MSAAHRRHRRAAAFWGHKPPLVATCDNPAKDASGLTAAVWAGDGRREFLFPGTVIVVESEEQCDAACEYLSSFTELGFDAENVAYLDGSGVGSDKAALVQLVGDQHKCFIFKVHAWGAFYPSFASLLANRRIKKIALGLGGDIARVIKRFDVNTDAVAGGVEVCVPS